MYEAVLIQRPEARTEHHPHEGWYHEEGLGEVNYPFPNNKQATLLDEWRRLVCMGISL